MPWTQKHRGKHPQDDELFNSSNLYRIGQAVNDYSFLLDKQYGDKASIKLVGDRYQLTARQRMAVQRISLPESEVKLINEREVVEAELDGQTLAMDGFNLLIFTEAILSKGYVFECRDGVYRDIASIHGSYYKVLETPEAIELLLETINSFNPASTIWYFDAPVSNSGKLKKLIELELKNYPFESEVLTVNNPDKELIMRKEAVVLSSDRFIISHANRWFNLGKYLIAKKFHDNDNIITQQLLNP